MLDSRALTKIQSIILIAVVAIPAVGGAAIVLWDGPSQSSETIKIGVLADLNAVLGKKIWRSILLAAEQLNAEGGILGKQIEVIGEDTDSETSKDQLKITNALTRLISYHEVDFVIGQGGLTDGPTVQEIIRTHKITFIDVYASDELSQRVLDDYDEYKYYFSTDWNETTMFFGMTDGLVTMREITGFNKVGIIGQQWAEPIVEGLDNVLPELYDFEIVYKTLFPYETVDFSSYYAAAEAAGVEVLVPLIGTDAAIPFVKEYYDRQSPLFIYGGGAGTVADPDAWDWTDGKCEHVCFVNTPIVGGYSLTSKTLQTREAYFNRWEENIDYTGSISYDDLRFILSDAIERAGTIETEAVIKALEETSVETSNTRNWVFTPSHGLMMGMNPNDPETNYAFVMYFQWQDGEQVPVYPKKIMEAERISYTFPDWPGPWDNIS
jgi:branched-chain amino acid transport system substrate-binding protein